MKKGKDRINFRTDLYVHKDFNFEPQTLAQWLLILDCSFTTLRNRVKDGTLIKKNERNNNSI